MNPLQVDAPSVHRMGEPQLEYLVVGEQQVVDVMLDKGLRLGHALAADTHQGGARGGAPQRIADAAQRPRKPHQRFRKLAERRPSQQESVDKTWCTCPFFADLFPL